MSARPLNSNRTLPSPLNIIAVNVQGITGKKKIENFPADVQDAIAQISSINESSC